ncbi:MAG: hypothetical protein V2A62_00960 [Candidatus Woesearchaeota archaeon]
MVDAQYSKLYQRAVGIAKEVKQASPTLLGDLANGMGLAGIVIGATRLIDKATFKKLKESLSELCALDEKVLYEMQDEAYQAQKRAKRDGDYSELNIAPYDLIRAAIKLRPDYRSQGLSQIKSP